MRESKKTYAKFDKTDSKVIKHKEEDLKFECQICMTQIENDKETFPLTNCEHIYHEECLKKYL